MSKFTKTLPEIHPKGWGKELWVANSEKYCGKILCFDAGKKCSWHYHDVKDEVFYLLRGKLRIAVSDQDDLSKAETFELNVGEAFHVKVGLRHQMFALEDSELLEVSTQHFEHDSIRLIKGD